MHNYVVTCAQMKLLEQNTDAAGLSYYQMMENAGTIAANRIVEITMTSPIGNAYRSETQETTAENSCRSSSPINDEIYAYQLTRPIRARVYCGKGNNGGDGFVVARLLRQRGWIVDLVLVDGAPVTPDAIANFDLLQRLDIPVLSLGEEAVLGPKAPAAESNASGTAAETGTYAGEKAVPGQEMPAGEICCTESDGEAGSDGGIAPGTSAGTSVGTALGITPGTSVGIVPDVIVDAIYGTGFHGQLRDRGVEAAARIAAARRQGARVFALDIPSGMGGDLTEEADLDPRCVRADVTITFHAKKPVHLQAFAEAYCGRIITADIGIVDPDRDRYLQRNAVNGMRSEAEMQDGIRLETAAGQDAEGRPGTENRSDAEGRPGAEKRSDTEGRPGTENRSDTEGRPGTGKGPGFDGDRRNGPGEELRPAVKQFDLRLGETYGFADLVEIISRLRAPDGCPWDREQTHQTLKKYLLEETQEAADAIDNADDENLCEELGDVLLQIVLHAQIGRERQAFTMDDVVQGICEKMIRRHPWVFGDMKVDSPEEGERLWEQIKQQEKAARDQEAGAQEQKTMS